MLDQSAIAHLLLHLQKHLQTDRRWVLLWRAECVAGKRNSTPRIIASGVMQRGGQHGTTRRAERSELIECFARERKNIDGIAAQGERNRQHADAKSLPVRRIDST